MADINSFAFTGRLTKDAGYTTLASGKGLLVANVAINTGFGDYKKTLYVKVQQWGESGQNIAKYLTKGTLVGGVGEVSLNSWSSKEGKQYTDVQIDVRFLNILSSKSNGNIEAQTSDAGWQKKDVDEDTVF